MKYQRRIISILNRELVLGENIQVHMYFVVKLQMADSGCLGDERR